MGKIYTREFFNKNDVIYYTCRIEVPFKLPVNKNGQILVWSKKSKTISKIIRKQIKLELNKIKKNQTLKKLKTKPIRIIKTNQGY